MPAQTDIEAVLVEEYSLEVLRKQLKVSRLNKILVESGWEWKNAWETASNIFGDRNSSFYFSRLFELIDRRSRFIEEFARSTGNFQSGFSFEDRRTLLGYAIIGVYRFLSDRGYKEVAQLVIYRNQLTIEDFE